MFSGDVEVIQLLPGDPDGTMLMPLDDIKDALGISGTTQDASITRAAKYATSILENYCDRGLVFCRRRETHDMHSSNLVFLWAMPIVGTPIATIDDAASNATIYRRMLGIVDVSSSYALRDITIEYDGGYQNVPGDLADVFLKVVNSSISTQGVASTVGMVKSVSIPDAISISYDMGAAASQVAASGDAPLELTAYVGALAPYRRIAL